MGLIVGILDRWLLQVFSGSVQQGFYGLSYQIGALCSLFTTAMTPLITREFSIAFGNQDLSQMAILFRRYIPLLYSIAAYFACFIAVQADKVTYIFGGTQFHQASLVVAIMSFYPIHQTYGQLSGSVFYATGQTGLYRNIGIVFILAGIPITFFLIAPVNMMGLDAGATGLAVKMVLLQFLGVNVFFYFNAKYLKLSFFKYVAHQIACIICLLAIAVTATTGVDRLLGSHAHVVFNFLLAGFVYSVMVIAIVYYIPAIFGLKRDDIHLVSQLITAKVSKHK